MEAKTQAFDIIPTPRVSHYPLPLRQFRDNETWIQLGQESPLMNKKGLNDSIWKG